MTEDKLSFLDQARDEQGRFASKDNSQDVALPPPSAPPEPPVPEAQPAQTPDTPSQPSAVTPPPGYIPMAAVLDERDKRQAAQREAEEFRRKYEEATRKPPQPIDPIADPEAFERSFNERLERVRWDAITAASHTSALRHYGAEKVKAAEEWLASELQSNPAIWQSVQRQADPYDFVVSQHQRAVRLQKIGDDDPEAWAQKWAEANGYVKTSQQQSQAAGVAAPSPQSTLPRPSLASAPSAGGKSPTVPVGPGEAFNAVFK